jgi:hypothetical protein
VVVAPDRDALRGPLHGRRQLPLHLDSSARQFYDFGSRRDRAQAYQLVLLEAADRADLEQWLQQAELLRLWAELYLPRRVRAAWQGEHLILARIGAGPHVPQPSPRRSRGRSTRSRPASSNWRWTPSPHGALRSPAGTRWPRTDC